jgi:nicotinamidase-related amidase
MKNWIHTGIISLALLALPALAAPLQAADAPRTLRDLGGVVPRPAVNPADAVLIIIDAQNEYRSGALPLEGVDAAIGEIVRLRQWAQMSGIPVIHVRHETPAGAPIFAKGSNGSEIVSELTPAAGENIVVKTRPNSFAGTTLDDLLKKAGRHQLIITGFMAHMCVSSTTRAASDRGYTIFVVGSATADRAIPSPDGKIVSGNELRDVSLTALNDGIAWVVPTADALMAALK